MLILFAARSASSGGNKQMDNDLSLGRLGSATSKFRSTQEKQVSHPNKKICPGEKKNLDSNRTKIKP